jgi:lipoprotein-releasing system ATP-binding protein
MSEPGAVLEAEGLVKGYSSGEGWLEVLRGVDLAVGASEKVAIIGPSGSGKSTLLHCLGGLERPEGGRVRIGAVDLSGRRDAEVARARNREIGFVFQFHHLLPDFTAEENVMLPRLIDGAAPADARERARRALDEVGLLPRAHHAPAALSGGEQQRVAVARALVNAPRVVLADEPSGNLDPVAGSALHALLDRLRADRGVTFVIATHDPGLARSADRILALRDGRLVPVAPQGLAEAFAGWTAGAAP